MEFVQFLTELQSAYVAEFEASYEQMDSQSRTFPEVALQISGGVYRDLYVADFVLEREGQRSVVEVSPTDQSLRGPASFVDSGFSVHFEVVSWDAMRFHIEDRPFPSPAFDAWFGRWLDIDREPETGRITTGVIHSVTVEPTAISVDFGTAPADAAVELLAVLRAGGMVRVHITSARE